MNDIDFKLRKLDRYRGMLRNSADAKLGLDIAYGLDLLDQEAARLRRESIRGATLRFHPVAPGVWRINDRNCRQDRRSLGMVLVWLLLVARAYGASAVPLEWTSQSANSLRNALRRVAAWLADQSQPLAEMVARIEVSDANGVLFHARPTDPELIVS